MAVICHNLLAQLHCVTSTQLRVPTSISLHFADCAITLRLAPTMIIICLGFITIYTVNSRWMYTVMCTYTYVIVIKLAKFTVSVYIYIVY